MRYRLLLLLALFCCNTPKAQTVASFNLDMEQKTGPLPVRWWHADMNNEHARFVTTDSVIRHGGRYSIAVDWTHPPREWTTVSLVIDKKLKGDSVKMSGFLRTEDVKGWSGFWLRVDDESGNSIAFENMDKRGVSGTTDWTEYSITLPYDEEKAARVLLGTIVSGSGRIWFDDFKVTVDGKELSEAIVNVAPLKADLDTAFRHSSGIRSLPAGKEKTELLADLGQLWGFLKYYHAGVQAGDFNMDAALFRILPQVVAAPGKAEAYKIMERWVDSFGTPPACPSCEKEMDEKKIKLKPNYGRLFEKGHFPSSLVSKLEYIRDNRYQGGEKHYYIGQEKYGGYPVFRHEQAYDDMDYADAGLRLLCLYRCWNIINYFYPNRHLIDGGWNKVLTDMIPEFVAANDAVAYGRACQLMIARVQDTHANIWKSPADMIGVKGKLVTPFQAKFIEEKLVVTGYYADTLGVKEKVKAGDVIEAIDGVPVKERVQQLLPLTAASNFDAQLRDLPLANGYLLRSNAPEVKLRIDRDGQMLDVTCPRMRFTRELWALDWKTPVDTSFRMLPGNIGYIYPALLKEGDLEYIKKAFRDTRGIVIDMRCYPGVFMPFTYGAWLKSRPSTFVRFSRCSFDRPGLFWRKDDAENGQEEGDHYKGKLVILVDSRTQSQAEYTTMALQTVPGAVVIGSTTSGADGNVATFLLPGGISTMLSSIGVYYPDGSETQRVGVKIDKVLRPTIKGFREGRDELLEAAVKTISGE